MKALDSAIRKTQAWWGVDKDTAEHICIFLAMRQLINPDAEVIWDEMHKAFPNLFSIRKIRCVKCEQVIVFWPNDGTITVRDDGELICLDCQNGC